MFKVGDKVIAKCEVIRAYQLDGRQKYFIKPETGDEDAIWIVDESQISACPENEPASEPTEGKSEAKKKSFEEFYKSGKITISVDDFAEATTEVIIGFLDSDAPAEVGLATTLIGKDICKKMFEKFYEREEA